jgi:hypothetical protein
MPLDYLCQLDTVPLPLETRNKTEIVRISRLAAVGFLHAEIKPDFFGKERSVLPESATVLAITEAGREKIAKLRLGFQDTVPGSLT